MDDRTATEGQGERITRKHEFDDGAFETVKFARRRAGYYEGLNEMIGLGYSTADYLHNFPAFVGQMTLWRSLTLYELYKKTIGLAGHIGDVGIYMGASTLLFGKLVEIYEPESLTLVHGFDWFKGSFGQAEDRLLLPSQTYFEDEARVRALVRLQNLDHVVKIHKVDVVTEIDDFFQRNPTIRFKLVFLDSGTYDVTSSAIRAFWPRITPGGILVLDQFNNEVAPGETRAVTELLPDLKIETLPNSWMPSAFIQKPFAGGATA